MAHIRQAEPESGRGLQVKVLKIFKVVLSSLGSGTQTGSWRATPDVQCTSRTGTKGLLLSKVSGFEFRICFGFRVSGLFRVSGFVFEVSGLRLRV